MSTFADAINAVLATVTPGPRPKAPAVDDFGSDLWCTDDVLASFAELMPDDPLVVAQNCYRALKTIPGTLPDLDVKDWGLGLQLWLRKAATPTQIAALPGIIQSRLMALDERILEMSVTIALEIGSVGRYLITIRGRTASGPFSLVLSVSPSDVLLKAMAGP